jgi:hypothetical protein
VSRSQKQSRRDGSQGGEMPGHGCLVEPELSYHPERTDHRHRHPLEGLIKFGPLGATTVNRLLGPIRVGMLAPAGGLDRLDTLLVELERSHEPVERPDYLRRFPGFAQVFRVGLAAAPSAARLEFPRRFDDILERAEAPHLLLADQLRRALGRLLAQRAEFDVILIYLPDRWKQGFWGPEGDDFDLHDYIKAYCATVDLPTQIINDTGALDYRCRCSVAWRLGIALYTKAGGVPWRLVPVDHGTAYIGVSYALRPVAESRAHFVTCCSQVFDADGTGLEFLAYSPDDLRAEEGENPFLTRADMRRVMARSMTLYHQRHAGRLPSRVVVHKNSEFKGEEIDGCFEAFASVESVDLIQVVQTPWRGLHYERPRRGGGQMEAGYAAIRGTYLPLGPREVLLWTQGDAPDVTGGRHYFQGGKGIPAPLSLRRFAGHGGWEATCSDVLGLTKMNWNSDNLYDSLPVTLGFSSTLANVIKRMDRFGGRAFPIRLFM